MLNNNSNFLNKSNRKKYFSEIKKTTNYILNPKNSLLDKEISQINKLEKK